MKIAIVGAGVTGLTTAFYLSKKGHQVTVFEKNGFVGGLASGIKIREWEIERFYHHIFKSDTAIVTLVKELGLGNIWTWKDCGAPIFYQDKIYPFSSPRDLINFKPLSLFARFRTGIISLYLQLNQNYQAFGNIKAEQWLKRWMGEQSWQVVWEPLMKKKFGREYKNISMSWFWARVNKRSRFLGYPKGGFQVIWNTLAKEIIGRKGKILLNKEIKSLNELTSFNKIIFTGATPIFLKTLAKTSESYREKLNRIKYLGTVECLLLLKKPITDWVYWLNVNDITLPFVGIVQHSNLVDEKYYQDFHPVYLVAYTSFNSQLFKNNPKVIMKNWVNFLKKINSNFNYSWIEKWWVFKEPFTQPIFKAGDYKNIPDFKTCFKNVYLVNMAQIYPWDRGVNYAVEVAKKAVKVVLS